MKHQKRQKLIVILGPTSSGKTGLAQKLCKEFGGFIISADSRQVYRYMDIGTGKIANKKELMELRDQRQKLLKQNIVNPADYKITLSGIDNYMIDFVEPNCNYNVALFKQDVYRIINQISKTKNIFLVGGTGQYIDAVVDNWQFPKGEVNIELRRKLESCVAQEGLESLWKELIKRDSGCRSFVQKENPRRVVRALEFILRTGKKFSQSRTKGQRQFDVLKIGIKLDRPILYKKIDARVDSRIKMGMINEVKSLHNDHNVSCQRLEQFGLEYREISKYLQGVYKTADEMSERLKFSTHAFVRRQLTWFRKDKEINWVKNSNSAFRLLKTF